MLSVGILVRRGAPAAVAILLAGLLASGCSTVTSDDSWTGSTGTLEGVVRSEIDQPADGVDVYIWCDASADMAAQQYRVATNDAGCFTIENVELGSAHAFAKTYYICVNCAPLSMVAVDTRFGTYSGSVYVQKDGGTPYEIEIDWIPSGPGEPAQYFDDTP